MKAQFRQEWIDKKKWVEARLVEDVGRLAEGELVDVHHLGWATVHNVVSVRSGADMQRILGQDLTGLGVQSIKDLCDSCNIHPRLIDLGHLILFNLKFISANEAFMVSVQA